MWEKRKSSWLLVGFAVVGLLLGGCPVVEVQEPLELQVLVPSSPEAVRGYCECFNESDLDGESVLFELTLDEASGVWGGAIEFDVISSFRVVSILEDESQKTLSYALNMVEMNVSQRITVAPNIGHEITEELICGDHVFYEQSNRDYAADQWRYLCCAENDWHPSLSDPVIGWGYGGKFTELTDESIGSGKSNSDALYSLDSSAQTATVLCEELVCNDFTDWYLPSIEELELIHSNLYGATETTASFITDGFYWSSSEVDETKAICLQFDEQGDRIEGSKLLTNVIRVRPVRNL